MASKSIRARKKKSPREVPISERRRIGTIEHHRGKAISTVRVHSYLGRAVGTCAVDIVAQEYFKTGVIANYCKPLQLRQVIEQQAVSAVEMARDMLIRWPAERQQVQRLFRDLALIRHLIKRNRELGPNTLKCSVEGRDGVEGIDCEDATERLQSKLDDSYSEIESFLHDFQPEQDPPYPSRNFDPLAFFFMEFCFDVWCQLRPLMGIGLRCPQLPRADFPLFARFLAAAWKDLGLPITDHRMRSRLPLTGWFAERVRKHFTYKTEIAP